jgi:hypothetical protein
MAIIIFPKVKSISYSKNANEYDFGKKKFPLYPLSDLVW